MLSDSSDDNNRTGYEWPFLHVQNVRQKMRISWVFLDSRPVRGQKTPRPSVTYARVLVKIPCMTTIVDPYVHTIPLVHFESGWKGLCGPSELFGFVGFDIAPGGQIYHVSEAVIETWPRRWKINHGNVIYLENDDKNVKIRSILYAERILVNITKVISPGEGYIQDVCPQMVSSFVLSRGKQHPYTPHHIGRNSPLYDLRSCVALI